MKELIKQRTKTFAIRVIRLVDSLPQTVSAQVIAKQIVRSSTAVAANYRASCRARSQAEFIAKLGIVEEEADESLFWLELLVESGIVKKEKLELLMTEANELTSIIVSSIKTAKRSLEQKTRVKER
ncbi:MULTISPECIES: four helix bundle protein [Bacteroidota]|uniref:Four helix bundle protein n=1 Tax=Flectobacillus rivi TaxID=2984209 RepID=A0ABT6Z6J4_9BACT|nr:MULTISPECIES: four helix bundle protein [Bacteroidota]MDI9876747.1 four helix bundle protein [Flectobacillus rivi]NBB31026.1 four helix bundle protein [Cellulophaga sp. BC115SP]